MTMFDWALLVFWFLVLAYYILGIWNLLNDHNFYVNTVILKQKFRLKVGIMFHVLWIVPLVIAYRVWG